MPEAKPGMEHVIPPVSLRSLNKVDQILVCWEVFPRLFFFPNTDHFVFACAFDFAVPFPIVSDLPSPAPSKRYCNASCGWEYLFFEARSS